MANLTTSFIGIKSPNPFWLASAPPTDKEYNVRRAYEAGWGGVVWKTLGEAGPPVVNVNGPRYGALLTPDRRLMGFNNIELITDRDLEINLREITEVKRTWPDRAMVVSLITALNSSNGFIKDFSSSRRFAFSSFDALFSSARSALASAIFPT